MRFLACVCSVTGYGAGSAWSGCSSVGEGS